MCFSVVVSATDVVSMCFSVVVSIAKSRKYHIIYDRPYCVWDQQQKFFVVLIMQKIDVKQIALPVSNTNLRGLVVGAGVVEGALVVETDVVRAANKRYLMS